MTDNVTLARGAAADLPALEPLWVSVHHRHAESMPELGPYVSDAKTWTERRALYEALIAKPDTVLVLARAGEELVGYGLAHVLPLAETWIGDTWVTGERIGEIESVAVLAAHRGHGIGSRLLDELEAALAADGVEDLILGVLPGNDAAIRLYERRGYRATWTYLSRLRGR
jgi:ribosomal protein S18 acetylase RimI-like enzyme